MPAPRRNFSRTFLTFAALAVACVGANLWFTNIHTPGSVHASTAPSSQPSTKPSPLKIEVIDRPGPIHAIVAKLDLTDPSARIVIRPATEQDPDGEGPFVVSLDTVRSIAERDGLALAVNASMGRGRDRRHVFGREVIWFKGNAARPEGWWKLNGVLKCTPEDRDFIWVFGLDKAGTPSIRRCPDGLPEEFVDAVASNVCVVLNGVIKPKTPGDTRARARPSV
ncbi:MAG: hypothetical protein QM770_01005 [Tepidisphaeraceae bacterium]